jgi:hypothetical protein
MKTKIFLAVIMLTLVGCRDWSGIRGSGDVEEETRDIEKFEVLEVSGAFDVKVTLGEEPSLKLSGDDNLLKYVKIKNRGNRLEISTRKNINPREDMRILITNPSLNKLDVSRANTIKIRDIDAEEFEVNISGACSVALKGDTEKLRIDMSGASSLEAAELISKHVRVDCSGASNATVYASESIYADASGVCSIKFDGNPVKTDLDASGVSSIESLDY